MCCVIVLRNRRAREREKARNEARSLLLHKGHKVPSQGRVLGCGRVAQQLLEKHLPTLSVLTTWRARLACRRAATCCCCCCLLAPPSPTCAAVPVGATWVPLALAVAGATTKDTERAMTPAAGPRRPQHQLQKLTTGGTAHPAAPAVPAKVASVAGYTAARAPATTLAQRAKRLLELATNAKTATH